MKIVMINLGNFGSTGNIMLGIDKLARKQGHKTYVCYPDSRTNRKQKISNCIYIGNRIGRNFHFVFGTLLGMHGLLSIIDTHRFIKKLNRIKPDLIHLHNIHGFFVNFYMLFNYIKKHNIPVVWTLHDCWAFTGQCPHFSMINCNRWKTGCYDCPQCNIYPRTKIDHSQWMWKHKKKWFNGIPQMIIVTPSDWLADLVKQSFLGDYPIKVIHNGIDLSVFKPIRSDFKNKWKGTYLVVGVAFSWGNRKGLDVFIELSKRLDCKYQIILVGTNDEIDRCLPNNIVCIHSTQNQNKLAEIYNAADVFVNPTREDTFPTTNIESLACGTPVITFKTGGSPEILDKNCGNVVPYDDIDALEKEIINICENNLFDKNSCLKRAKIFDRNDRFQEYVELFNSFSNNR